MSFSNDTPHMYMNVYVLHIFSVDDDIMLNARLNQVKMKMYF